MALALIRKSTVPPGGYRYFIEATNSWVASGSFSGVVDAVMHHLKTNRLPIPSNLEQLVETRICQQIAAEIRDKVCTQVAGPEEPPIEIQRVMTWGDIANFLSVLKSWATHSGGLVSTGEATARAEVCSTCPYNIQVAGCLGCHEVANKLTQLVGAKTTGLEAKLRGCGVCGCDNRAQVWFPLEVLGKGITPDMKFPEWCWKKKSGAVSLDTTPDAGSLGG
jgi:hypothetical protein